MRLHGLLTLCCIVALNFVTAIAPNGSDRKASTPNSSDLSVPPNLALSSAPSTSLEPSILSNSSALLNPSETLVKDSSQSGDVDNPNLSVPPSEDGKEKKDVIKPDSVKPKSPKDPKPPKFPKFPRGLKGPKLRKSPTRPKVSRRPKKSKIPRRLFRRSPQGDYDLDKILEVIRKLEPIIIPLIATK